VTRRSPLACALVAGALAWVPAAAQAGQRPFLWAYDTNIVSTGNLELEQWLWFKGSSPGTSAQYWVWWSPVVGITRHLEAAVPFQLEDPGTGARLASLDADLRWRLFSQDDRGGFQGLVRAAFHRDTALHRSRLDLTLSTSWGDRTDPHVMLELGAQLAALSGSQAAPHVGTYDAGVAFPFQNGELQLALESFGTLRFDGKLTPDVYAGGSVAWTPGRFWVTLGTLVGLTSPTGPWPRFMPRLTWAVSL